MSPLALYKSSTQIRCRPKAISRPLHLFQNSDTSIIITALPTCSLPTPLLLILYNVVSRHTWLLSFGTREMSLSSDFLRQDKFVCAWLRHTGQCCPLFVVFSSSATWTFNCVFSFNRISSVACSLFVMVTSFTFETNGSTTDTIARSHSFSVCSNPSHLLVYGSVNFV